jgi:hypothetical protein
MKATGGWAGGEAAIASRGVQRWHVYDDRLFMIMANPDSAIAVRRVHKGYARLFFEELQARRQARQAGEDA